MQSEWVGVKYIGDPPPPDEDVRLRTALRRLDSNFVESNSHAVLTGEWVAGGFRLLDVVRRDSAGRPSDFQQPVIQVLQDAGVPLHPNDDPSRQGSGGGTTWNGRVPDTAALIERTLASVRIKYGVECELSFLFDESGLVYLLWVRAVTPHGRISTDDLEQAYKDALRIAGLWGKRPG